MLAGLLESALVNRLSSSASTLADHAAAYADIIIADVKASAQSAAGRVWSAAVMFIGLAFTVAIGCAWLIAATWNTDSHLLVMIGLLALGVLTTLAALLVLNRQRRTAPQPMALTMAEWSKDRDLVRELLGANEAAKS
jgi:hypothetical protein